MDLKKNRETYPLFFRKIIKSMKNHSMIPRIQMNSKKGSESQQLELKCPPLLQLLYVSHRQLCSQWGLKLFSFSLRWSNEQYMDFRIYFTESLNSIYFKYHYLGHNKYETAYRRNEAFNLKQKVVELLNMKSTACEK